MQRLSAIPFAFRPVGPENRTPSDLASVEARFGNSQLQGVWVTGNRCLKLSNPASTGMKPVGSQSLSLSFQWLPNLVSTGVKPVGD